MTWSSSAPAVVTVSSTGLVTTRAKGSALIEAVSEGKRGTSTISVSDPLDAIKMGVALPREDDIVGDTLSMIAFASGRNAIVRAQARVANKEVELVYELLPSGRVSGWTGMLDVSEIPFGPLQLVVSAYDAQGNVGTITVPIKKGTREGKGGTKLPPRSK